MQNGNELQKAHIFRLSICGQSDLNFKYLVCLGEVWWVEYNVDSDKTSWLVTKICIPFNKRLLWRLFAKEEFGLFTQPFCCMYTSEVSSFGLIYSFYFYEVLIFWKNEILRVYKLEYLWKMAYFKEKTFFFLIKIIKKHYVICMYLCIYFTYQLHVYIYFLFLCLCVCVFGQILKEARRV